MPINLPRRRIELFLLVAAILLALLGTGMEVSYYLLDHKRLLGAVRQFTLGGEANIPTWYSAMLLASCALCLAAIAFTQTPDAGNYRRHWLILALIFLYILASPQNPKILVRDDSEIVGDGVAPRRPLSWQSSAEEIVDGFGEEGEAGVEAVVGHLAMHDAP